MASLERDRVSGRYRIRFRYGGQAYKRSTNTSDKREARSVQGRVEETIRLIERGRLVPPPHADPGTFILSDGKLNGNSNAPEIRTLGSLFDRYQKELPEGAKECSTIAGELTHTKHLLRHLKASRVIQRMTVGDMQTYVDRRLRDRWRGKPIRPGTIKKEITTFRLIWRWGVDHGYLEGPAPIKGVKYPKIDQKPPFMTSSEIQKILDRGGLAPEEEKELWACLFLTELEIREVLEDVRANARHLFIYPMFVFAAHTGARRSEILRSQVEDLDLSSRTALIREKKSKEKAITYRRVPMTDLLVKAMSAWLDCHPGGRYTFCQGLVTRRGKRRADYAPLTASEARDHFKRTLRDSQWERIRGFHVLRHSFASNLAAAGVDQRIIDEWMGHQTEEMRKRYRHLFPDQQQKVIDSVFGGNGK